MDSNMFFIIHGRKNRYALSISYIGHLFFKDSLVFVSKNSGDFYDHEFIYKWYNENLEIQNLIVSLYNGGMSVSEIVKNIWNVFTRDMEEKAKESRERADNLDYGKIYYKVYKNLLEK